MVTNEIILGDCFEMMPQIAAKSVNLIATDLPYGTTQNKWDKPLDLVRVWKLVDYVLADNGSFVTTSTQPFTSMLVCSKLAWYKDEVIWHKTQATGHLNAEIQPMNEHENILIFSKSKTCYNPQVVAKDKANIRPLSRRSLSDNYGKFNLTTERSIPLDMTYPRSVIKLANANRGEIGLHPTQKPIALFEWIIRTYSNPTDLVLDFCGGSGTTAIAAYNTNRNFIVIEKEAEYHQIAVDRLARVKSQLRFEEMVS